MSLLFCFVCTAFLVLFLICVCVCIFLSVVNCFGCLWASVCLCGQTCGIKILLTKLNEIWVGLFFKENFSYPENCCSRFNDVLFSFRQNPETTFEVYVEVTCPVAAGTGTLRGFCLPPLVNAAGGGGFHKAVAWIPRLGFQRPTPV